MTSVPISKIKNRITVFSLPLKLDGKTPKFEQPPIDFLFWKNYNSNMDIHEYVSKRIGEMKLTLSEQLPPKGSLCKLKNSEIKLFKYQLVQTILGSPYSPLKRMLIIASTGTGKTCTLIGIANHHIKKNIKDNKKYGIIFVAATHALFTNFVKQSMNCPGDMRNIAKSMGLTNSNDQKGVEQFKNYIKKYIYPLNYTEFGNMISGKYKKYEHLPSLEDKLILMDEAHYLVDSINTITYKPDYERVPVNWRSNLKMMYDMLTIKNNPNLKGTQIVGATATPITSSIMEYFSLINIFANRPITNETLKTILKHVNKLEQSNEFGSKEQSKLKILMKMIEPVIKESVSMYVAKTSDSVLDTSIFPEMKFKTIKVPLSDSQKSVIYSNKNLDI